ncbi:fused MFS/spermidine synthase, partial [Streptomyces yerevanensis]|uniref:fused MFS/spermidine synthase n=1 Tax=Streptomyces yerevanensis TaxID=66378 RepID=UPI001FDF11B6
MGLREEPSRSRDLIVEDAFGAHSPPWHLTTQEVAEEGRRVLRPGGLYTVNMIDFPPGDFARSEIATLRAVFPHVMIVSFDKIIKGEEGGNVVAVAGDRPMPVDQLQR